MEIVGNQTSNEYIYNMLNTIDYTRAIIKNNENGKLKQYYVIEHDFILNRIYRPMVIDCKNCVNV